MHLSLTSSCCLQKVFEKNSAVKTHEKRVATRYPRGLPVVIPANKGKYPKPYINIETRAINTEIERSQIFQKLHMRYFLLILLNENSVSLQNINNSFYLRVLPSTSF